MDPCRVCRAFVRPGLAEPLASLNGSTVNQLLAGGPSLAAGRSPDAARVRGLLATPAGADPLHTSRRNRFASLMEAGNCRYIIL